MQKMMAILFNCSKRYRDLISYAVNRFEDNAMVEGRVTASFMADRDTIDTLHVMEVVDVMARAYKDCKLPLMRGGTMEKRMRMLLVLVYAYRHSDKFGIFTKGGFITWSRECNPDAPAWSNMGALMQRAGLLLAHDTKRYELTFDGRAKAKLIVEMYESVLRKIKA